MHYLAKKLQIINISTLNMFSYNKKDVIFMRLKNNDYFQLFQLFKYNLSTHNKDI